jgi:tight adherence protein C
MLLGLLALVLLGLAASLLVRALAIGRTRVTATLGTITEYGYASAAPSEAAARSPIQATANRLGEALSGRISLDSEKVRDQLLSAGIYRVNVRAFLGYRALAAMALGTVWLWLITVGGRSPVLGLVGAALAGSLGWYLPTYVVKKRALRRLLAVDRELPELIDLLVVTVEAGLGFSASLQLAADHMDGPVGDELRLVVQEQRMGLSTSETLQHLVRRAETPAVISFVRAIIQGETLGVSVGQILRDLATDMRRRRRQHAQERAQKAPIKMLFPLVLLIFPAMFVVLLGPAIIAILRTFSS